MEAENRGQIVWLPVDKIFPHPDNPRKDLGDLSELTASIQSRGVLQNLTVVPRVIDGQLQQEEYTSVIGHRRCAAAKAAGLLEVPCVISDMTAKEQFETMMIENVQRNALTVYEQAKGFQMMLDMGDSIEDVARKTGFSASTIRRRAQLASLNEEKFRKTECRGASLEDYLKLSKILDPAQQEAVLEKIGTAEFNNAYKRAIEEQDFSAYFAKLKIAIHEADWITEKTNETIGSGGKYDYYTRYGRGCQKMPEMPEDAKPGVYIYTICGDFVNIYRKRAMKKSDPVENLKKKLEKELDQIDKQLDQITDRHRQMRREFVQNFSAVSTNEMDIAAFAAKALAEAAGSENAKGIGELLGIKVYRPEGTYSDRLTQKDWNNVLFNRPMQALLCAAFAYLDGKWQHYNTTTYESRLHVSIPKHSKDKRLDAVYDGLCSIGYEMCEEETQMRDGTHPLFKQAQQLVEICKEDIKNAKKKPTDK